jgi:hypothetical protein
MSPPQLHAVEWIKAGCSKRGEKRTQHCKITNTALACSMLHLNKMRCTPVKKLQNQAN